MATLPRLVNAWFPNFVDVLGGQANPMWCTADQSDAGFGPFAGLASATQALSVAGLFAGVTQVRGIVGATPVAGVYGTVTDQVVFGVTSVARQGQLAIPAPVDTIFKPDNVTVDLDNGDVQAWFTAVSSVLGDSYGNPWTGLVWGQRRKIQRF